MMCSTGAWIRAGLVGAVVMAGSLVVSSEAAAAASAPPFKRLDLKVDGRVAHLMSRDLDADGLAELVAFTRSGTDERPLRQLAFWKGKPGGPDLVPTQVLALPEDAVLVDACDVLPAEGAEVLVLTADGLSAFMREGGVYRAARPVLEVPGVLGFPDDEDAPFFHMCQAPLGAQSPVELWVPTMRGISVVVPDGAGALKVTQQLNMRPKAYHQGSDEFRGPRARRDFAVLTMLVIPRLVNLDADHDGDDDLFQVVEDTVSLFVRDGGVLQAAPTFRRGFNLRSSEDRAKRNAVMDVMLGDMTGDGLPEAVVTKLAGGMTSLKSETRIYRGLGAAGFDEKPLGTRKMKGYATPLAMLDVDGDGRMEVLEPDIATTPVAVAGMLVKQRLDADVRLLRVENGSIKAGEDMTVAFALDTSGGGGVKGGLPLLGQDVDRDGRMDIINLGSGDEVELMRGVKGDPPFEEDASWTGPAPSTLRAEWYVPWPGGPASVVVFFPDPKIGKGTVLMYWNPLTATPR